MRRTFRDQPQQAQIALLEAIVQHLREENDRLRGLADRDPLTGLANRRRFEAALLEAIGAAHRYHGTMAVLMLDLDGMKQVNDGGGHAAGDELLKSIAEVLNASVRGCDVTARLGGDEFAVVMPATDSVGAQVVAERVRARIAELELEGGLRVTASIGIAQIGDARDPRRAGLDVLLRADAALYAAKRGGKDRVESTLSYQEAA
jgi:diguanylate cyclase (GGDEF)-like protein